MGRSRDLADLGDLSVSTLKVDTITDTSGGNTTSINSTTPTANTNVGKNVIINGAMQVWQRGTSSTSTGYTTADRIFMGNNTANSRSTDVPTGFKYSLDVTGTTGGSAGYGIVSQHIEAANIKHLVGQPATLSAYVKNVGTSTANLACELYYANTEDGFGGGSTVTYISSPTSQAITTGWTRVTFPSFTLPANAANGLRLVLFRYDPSNNQQWRITGIQLELGSNATNFEHRSYGTELALCQRYYEYGKSWAGPRYSDSAALMYGAFKVTKRTTPTMTYSSISGGTPGTNTADVSEILFYCSSSQNSDGRAWWYATAEL